LPNKVEDYQRFRTELGRRIRAHEPVDARDFERLTKFDQVAFERLYRECNRPIKRVDTTAKLKVVRETNGIQLVEGAFSSTDDPDAFYYHVTQQKTVTRIFTGGFSPALGMQRQTSKGVYRDYSHGKVFFCDRPGVAYWEHAITQQLLSNDGKPPMLAILRFLKVVPPGLTIDNLGTKESYARSWYSTELVKAIGGKP
jgi:hypothetical protein